MSPFTSSVRRASIIYEWTNVGYASVNGFMTWMADRLHSNALLTAQQYKQCYWSLHESRNIIICKRPRFHVSAIMHAYAIAVGSRLAGASNYSHSSWQSHWHKLVMEAEKDVKCLWLHACEMSQIAVCTARLHFMIAAAWLPQQTQVIAVCLQGVSTDLILSITYTVLKARERRIKSRANDVLYLTACVLYHV